RGNTLVIVSR
nr:Chain B, Alkaline phosphatase peptide [Escherichia coli K-12]